MAAASDGEDKTGAQVLAVDNSASCYWLREGEARKKGNLVEKDNQFTLKGCLRDPGAHIQQVVLYTAVLKA